MSANISSSDVFRSSDARSTMSNKMACPTGSRPCLRDGRVITRSTTADSMNDVSECEHFGDEIVI